LGLGALFGRAKPTKSPPWRRDWVGGTFCETYSISW